MTLRTRLMVTTLAVAAPLAAGLFVFAEKTRIADMQASIDRALDEGCEVQGLARRSLGEGGSMAPRVPPPRGPQRAPLEVHPYTAEFLSARPDGRGPEFPADLRAQLATQDTASGAWTTGEGRGWQTAIRMPEESGCAILLARMRPRPGEFRERLVGLSAVVLVVILAVTIAAGTTVARIRRLSDHVRATGTREPDTPLPIAGNDEVATLAKALQEARRDARTHLEEVEAREQTLRDFVANTTHDVAVPLTVLQTHLSALEGQSFDADTSGRVRDAMREAHYMGSLLRNLAAASRLDGGVPIEPRPIDIAALVERVVARHQPLARATAIDLNVAIPTSPTIVHADATLAEQAVGNLVDNAIRYNRPGGHVAVVLDHRGASFVLRVQDDGVGVEGEELSRLATRRFRGGAARSRRPDGQGLGLAITSEAAAAFGWQLSFRHHMPSGLVAELTGATELHTKS
jgi:signal transduction histidine kinase